MDDTEYNTEHNTTHREILTSAILDSFHRSGMRDVTDEEKFRRSIKSKRYEMNHNICPRQGESPSYQCRIVDSDKKGFGSIYPLGGIELFGCFRDTCSALNYLEDMREKHDLSESTHIGIVKKILNKKCILMTHKKRIDKAIEEYVKHKDNKCKHKCGYKWETKCNLRNKMDS